MNKYNCCPPRLQENQRGRINLLIQQLEKVPMTHLQPPKILTKHARKWDFHGISWDVYQSTWGL
jgi:hypothetical protein